MRRKITFGFMSLVLLLLVAGAISVYELRRLSNLTNNVIEQGNRDAEFAERMISALQKENSSVITYIFSEATSPDAAFDEGRREFREALAAAVTTIGDEADLARIADADDNFHAVIAYHLANMHITDVEWFTASYLPAYYRLDESVTGFLTSPDNSYSLRTEMLENNVYKTITPSILTLIVAILLVLMLYLFLDTYYMRPLTKINKSLRGYISTRVPFNPKFDSNNDDITALRDNISALIEQKRD